MEIAKDQAEKLKELGAIEVIDRWSGKHLLYQGVWLDVKEDVTDVLKDSESVKS